MANKQLFSTNRGPILRETDTTNFAGGKAYSLEAKHALAQYVFTGCLNSTFYASANTQLNSVLDLCKQVPYTYIAKAALAARTDGYMKDAPALLCAALISPDIVGEENLAESLQLLETIFPTVIDNGKMLRNFVQIVRSGATGRKSFGSSVRRMIRNWLRAQGPVSVFKVVGNDPSITDILKMVHPRPKNHEEQATYRYLICNEKSDNLPGLIKHFENFKTGKTSETPNVPFQMLTALPLTENHWKEIAWNAKWQMTRMNLNTFARHGVFNDPELVNAVIERLTNKKDIESARAFPYQLLTTYNNLSNDVPKKIKNALQDAVDLSLVNVPTVEGDLFVFVDVSGSMTSPITGYRKGATSVTTCREVAALMASALLQKNPETRIFPFSDRVTELSLNPRNSVVTNQKIIFNIFSGGTNCSLPLALLNRDNVKAKNAVCIYLSDNESWMDSNGRHGCYYGWGNRHHTGTLDQWSTFKHRNKNAKLVCVDLTPNNHTQAYESNEVLNVGGFSDFVFDVIGDFVKYGKDTQRFVDRIESKMFLGES